MTGNSVKAIRINNAGSLLDLSLAEITTGIFLYCQIKIFSEQHFLELWQELTEQVPLMRTRVQIDGISGARRSGQLADHLSFCRIGRLLTTADSRGNYLRLPDNRDVFESFLASSSIVDYRYRRTLQDLARAFDELVRP